METMQINYLTNVKIVMKLAQHVTTIQLKTVYHVLDQDS